MNLDISHNLESQVFIPFLLSKLWYLSIIRHSRMTFPCHHVLLVHLLYSLMLQKGNWHHEAIPSCSLMLQTSAKAL